MEKEEQSTCAKVNWEKLHDAEEKLEQQPVRMTCLNHPILAQ